MNAWWFIHHSVDGKGYETVKSNGLDEVLSHKNLLHLQRLDPPGGNERIQTVLWDDKLIAASYVAYDDDEMGRSTLYNHTLLFWWDDYLKLQGSSKFEKYFIREDMPVPSKLGALHIK